MPPAARVSVTSNRCSAHATRMQRGTTERGVALSIRAQSRRLRRATAAAVARLGSAWDAIGRRAGRTGRARRAARQLRGGRGTRGGGSMIGATRHARLMHVRQVGEPRRERADLQLRNRRSPTARGRADKRGHLIVVLVLGADGAGFEAGLLIDHARPRLARAAPLPRRPGKARREPADRRIINALDGRRRTALRLARVRRRLERRGKRCCG
mmetsp:Transcript_6189/g.19360  ORF Transcript_6189/g.19360 Transcript_6189/m.19360 type:complete len:212 (+) Transcript_6189:829-1464(+)